MRLRGFSTVKALCLLLGLVAAFAWTGCGDMNPPDPDDEMLKAKGLLANAGQVKDSVDHAGGDKRDWRVFEHFEDARVKITYRIGDPFKGHNVNGVIELFDATGNKLASKSVAPGTVAYEIEFEADANTKYFLVFNIGRGHSDYMIDCKAETLDPCAQCGDDEVCEDGRCVPKPVGCDPECGSGEECVDGECQKLKCERDEYFHKRSGECRPNPCYRHKCGKGKKCRISRGKAKCVAIKKKGCAPACGKGEVCKGTKCVKTDKPAEPAKKKIPSGKILNYWPQGKSTIMLLNRGSEHGVKKGMRGSIKGGGSFVVVDVYPFQCRAQTKLSREQLAGKKKVTFKQK